MPEPGSEAARRPAGTPAWAQGAVVAAATAADRPELWIPGALATMAFLGWLPFMLAVAVLPSPGDLAFWGADLATAESFPLNVVLLVVSALLVMIAASILVASGEVALQRAIGRILRLRPADRSLDDAAARLWVVEVVTAVPALAALAATALGVVAVAPGEYQSPDIGGPLPVRIAEHIWPFVAVALVALVVGVAWGAAAQRAAVGAERRSLASALAEGLAAVLRHPVRRLGLALATLAVLAAWLAATWALLHLLWSPIGRDLGSGALLDGGTPLLLIGFVAIWLCLVAAGGALHGWASAWWTLELAELSVTEPEPDPRLAEEAERTWI